MNKVNVGDIVKITDPIGEEGGYYRVRSIRGSKANLTGPFGSKIYHKGISVDRLTECQSEWYSIWSQSESYQCM